MTTETTITEGNQPIIPDSPDEWALEQAAFHANRDGVPDDVREVIQKLWAQVVAREAWFSALPSDAGLRDCMLYTADEAWQELVEKDDRTSPEEYPDMALITKDELRDYMEAGK